MRFRVGNKIERPNGGQMDGKRFLRSFAAAAAVAVSFGLPCIENIRSLSFPAAYAETAGSKVSILAKKLDDPVAEVRISALKEFAVIAEKTPNSPELWRIFPRLIKALKDPSPQVRGYAAVPFGWAKERKAVPAIINALGDDNELVRGSFAIALGMIGVDDQQFERISTMLTNAKRWQKRAGAAQALGQIRDVKALPLLWDAKQNEQKREVLYFIRSGISEFCHLPTLTKALEHKNAMIRKRGAQTLIQMFQLVVGLKSDDYLEASNVLFKVRKNETDSQVRDAMDEAHIYILENAPFPKIYIIQNP